MPKDFDTVFLLDKKLKKMKYTKKISFIGIFLLAVACAINPFTGKKTLALVPNSQIFPMAFQQYNQVLEESNVVRGTDAAQMVKDVGSDIAHAAEIYLNAHGYEEYLENYRWEYTLIQSDEINAWCMPGGKIAVYTGILPIAENKAGLAAILGHEVAHALANHGQQRMSAAELQQLGAIGLSAATANSENQQIFATAYGLGTQLGVMLPFSRSNETEADKIGLTLMAIAGYDPQAAVDLWYRMANAGGAQPPEFLSTHPSYDTRINNLQKWVDDAKAEARKLGVTSFK